MDRFRGAALRPLTLIVALLLAAGLAGCGPVGAQPLAPLVGGLTGRAPLQAAQADDHQEAYRRVEQVVSSLRGLRSDQPIELRFMSQAELQQYLLDAFERDYTPDERIRDHRLLVALGMIRPDQDLADLSLRLLGEQVLGMYDNDSRRMYLIADAVDPTPASRVVYAHEYTHALQDLTFGLKSLDPPDSDNDDRSGAVQALVEGDATLLMSHYLRQALTPSERLEYIQSADGSGSSALDEAPLVLKEELVFPYREGLRFVQQLHQSGGWAAVNQAYVNPPASTEQVLHPAKYFAGEAPIPVGLPDLAAELGPGWRQLVNNTLGELDLRILVEQNGSRQEALLAAEGWGGDRYALLEDDQGRAVVVIRSTWDTQSDAAEFFEAYGRALASRFGPAARLPGTDPTLLAFSTPEQGAQLLLRGTEVLVAFGPDQDLTERAMGALLGRLAPS